MGKIVDLKNETTDQILVSPVALAASALGSAYADLQGYENVVKVILAAGAGGSGATMDVKIQDCDTSGGSYADVTGATFTQVGNAASLQSIGLDVRSCRRYIKAYYTIGGTASFATAMVVTGQKQTI